MQVWSLGLEDAMEKEMTTHSSILAWEISWTEVGCSPWGHKEPDRTEQEHARICAMPWLKENEDIALFSVNSQSNGDDRQDFSQCKLVWSVLPLVKRCMTRMKDDSSKKQFVENQGCLSRFSWSELNLGNAN